MIKLKDVLMEEKCSDTAGIILQSDVGVVLVKEDEWWGIPKGKIDSGETPLEAAIRETVEETSILVAAYGSHINTPVTEIAKKKNSRGGDFYIFKTILKLPIIPIKSHEHEEVRYFDNLPDEVDPRLEGLV
jgi:8-oxo-dGTP pyrophosphatase MutT (NUDIX family)